MREVGSAPVISEFETPRAAAGQSLVEIELAGLNPVDLWIADGAFHGGSPPVPYVAGLEGVGRVDGEGPLVYFGGAVAPFGSFAPVAPVLDERLIEVPAGTDLGQAVAFGIAGLAGWLAVSWRAGLSSGEKVIVLGASGSVGQIATQAARLHGAARVVGAARSAAGRERAMAAGADAVVELDAEADPEELTEALVEAADGPADVVIDTLWGPQALAALAATGVGGRLVQVGNSSGVTELRVPAGLLRGKLREIRGHTNGLAPDDVRIGAYQDMCRHSITGKLKLEVEELPLNAVPEAWERQRESPGVKLVIRP